MDNNDNLNSHEQIIIRIGNTCNYKCIFCNVTQENEKEISYKESYTSLIRQFHEKIKTSYISSLYVTISGGEPTLFKKEVYFLVKYINKFCTKNNINIGTIDMQTNATMFDKKFLLWLLKNNVNDFLISFHTIDKKSFNELLGVDYNKYFLKVVENIKLVKSMGFRFTINVIINKINKDNFIETIKFIIKEFQKPDIEIGVVQPNGYGKINFQKLYVSFEEIHYIYNYSLFYVKKNNISINSHFCGIPLCYIDKNKFSVEYNTNLDFRKRLFFDDKFSISNLNDNSKYQESDCRKCLYNNVCSGLWHNYIGKQKLKPIFYKIDFFGDFIKNTNSIKILSKEINLKKIYDSNIRHLIIPTSIGNNNFIQKLIKDSTKIGFYKISLLVNTKFKFDKEILKTGLGNIQINIEDVSDTLLDEIINFSNKYKPQFFIDIDIFITKYDQNLLQKIKDILDKYNNLNFIKLFFIYNFNNKDIFGYKDLIINEKNGNIYTINFLRQHLYNYNKYE
ncbi:MAG: radical SAM protein [Candidatus Gracilibacteria bacterium]|nr:radical SAM protein [Candidatus Gracilibacteria bacterium]